MYERASIQYLHVDGNGSCVGHGGQLASIGAAKLGRMTKADERSKQEIVRLKLDIEYLMLMRDNNYGRHKRKLPPELKEQRDKISKAIKEKQSELSNKRKAMHMSMEDLETLTKEANTTEYGAYTPT